MCAIHEKGGSIQKKLCYEGIVKKKGFACWYVCFAVMVKMRRYVDGIIDELAFFYGIVKVYFMKQPQTRNHTSDGKGRQ